jgi:hypothetical protein
MEPGIPPQIHEIKAFPCLETLKISWTRGALYSLRDEVTTRHILFKQTLKHVTFFDYNLEAEDVDCLLKEWIPVFPNVRSLTVDCVFSGIRPDFYEFQGALKDQSKYCLHPTTNKTQVVDMIIRVLKVDPKRIMGLNHVLDFQERCPEIVISVAEWCDWMDMVPRDDVYHRKHYVMKLNMAGRVLLDCNKDEIPVAKLFPLLLERTQRIYFQDYNGGPIVTPCRKGREAPYTADTIYYFLRNGVDKWIVSAM